MNEKTTATEQAIAIREEKNMAAISGVTSFDWKAIPPPQMAQLLSKMPFKGGADGVDYYLTPIQATIFAIRCFELGLSPFSDECWFNPKNNKVNVTLSGKMKLARANGYNFGPPSFTRLERQVNGKPDYGYKCTMSVNGKEKAEYLAWHSEWAVATSPVWRSKGDHMLQLRSLEKCISFASGVGASELMGEQDIEKSAGKVPAEVVNAETVESNFVPMNTEKEK